MEMQHIGTLTISYISPKLVLRINLIWKTLLWLLSSRILREMGVNRAWESRIGCRSQIAIWWATSVIEIQRSQEEFLKLTPLSLTALNTLRRRNINPERETFLRMGFSTLILLMIVWLMKNSHLVADKKMTSSSPVPQLHTKKRELCLSRSSL